SPPPYTPPGGFPAGPTPRKKRGPVPAIIGTSVAVALILLLGGVVGYKILSSGSTSHGRRSSTVASGGPAGAGASGGVTTPASAGASGSASASSRSSGGTTSTVPVPWVSG